MINYETYRDYDYRVTKDNPWNINHSRILEPGIINKVSLDQDLNIIITEGENEYPDVFEIQDEEEYNSSLSDLDESEKDSKDKEEHDDDLREVLLREK